MSARMGNNRTDVKMLKHKFKPDNQVQMKHQDINTEASEVETIGSR